MFRVYLFTIVIFLSFTLRLNAQSEDWVRNFHPEDETSFADVIESYDFGYLVSGWFTLHYPSHGWLIKTDVNGNPLWEIVVGDDDNVMAILNHREDYEGNIYISGGVSFFDDYTDPYLMKLNACGEKLWCKVFHTPNNYDLTNSVELLSNGDCLIRLSYHSYDMLEQRICIVRLNPSGEIIWKNYYAEENPHIYNEEEHDILLLPDNKILISGWCDYADLNTGWGYTKAFYICIDADGETLWEKVVDHEILGVDSTYHRAFYSDFNTNSSSIYSGIERAYPEAQITKPAFIRMDINGEMHDIYNLIEGQDRGKLYDFKFINDSLMMGSATWGIVDDKKTDNSFIKENLLDNTSYENIISSLQKSTAQNQRSEYDSSYAVIYDTLGNIKKQLGLNKSFLSVVQKTHDNKYLFLTNTNPEEEEIASTYLHKFNEDLEYDSIYTQPYEYDYLCDHEITYDTIILSDCDLIIGIEDHKVKSEDAQLQLYPNPASDIAVIRLPIFTQTNINSEVVKGIHTNYAYHKNASLQIMDINGRLVHDQMLYQNQTEIMMDVSGWNSGLYVVRLLVNGKNYDDVKMVVM
ncbi:MAG: T9SS type A sorting domain-containing protein [Bacteroidales bacterium]|nr:T9SS type A sorting domain-containing protein [Bacteroidales bacterium]